MEQSVLERNLEDELSDSLEVLDAQLAQPSSSHTLPSYRPTPWALVNQVLDVVDRVSGGRAAWVQRFFSFAFIGGCAAIVNMIVYAVVMYGIKIPVSPIIHNAIAFLLAAEISIMANFIPNDYVTFRHLS
ncbi:MAG: GtrA family protein, partial [Ktedonobacteraceae bacterium]|nr:GtrA family protein [Ktedonobacteraceae bacterium]